MKQTVHVQKHLRNGKPVKGYSQHREAWKQAGIAWSMTGASGVGTAAMVTQLGLAVISVVAILLTVILGVVSAVLTDKVVKQNRATQSKRPARKRRTWKVPRRLRNWRKVSFVGARRRAQAAAWQEKAREADREASRYQQAIKIVENDPRHKQGETYRNGEVDWAKRHMADLKREAKLCRENAHRVEQPWWRRT